MTNSFITASAAIAITAITAITTTAAVIAATAPIDWLAGDGTRHTREGKKREKRPKH